MSIESAVSTSVSRAARPSPRVTRAPATCRHCGARASAGDDFCCAGCAEVYRLLRDGGLLRYYELCAGKGRPADDAAKRTVDDKWLSLVEADLQRRSGLTRLGFDVEGIHCSGCVWLIEELFRRTGEPGRVLVNPALGTVDLWVAPEFPIASFVSDAASVGYRFGPRHKAELGSTSLVLRMGICIAIAMNAMIFAVSLYAGLEAGSLAWLFQMLLFGLTTASVAVGGSFFVRGAWRALRRRMLHLDLPIALGIVLGYAGSVWSLFTTGGEQAYFDTLAVFIALMLVGRFLRERVLEKNRSALLEGASPASLLVRRIRGTNVEIGSANDVSPGDRLLIAPGDVVPVEAELADAEGLVSLDWITGEAEPERVVRGAVLTAGAANAGLKAFQVEARSTLDASGLLALLGVPRAVDRTGDAATPFEAKVSRAWVVLVLLLAAAGFVGWLAATGDVALAGGVAVGVLVITCPCAFGIATPIGHEIVLAGLRKAGLLVRSASFLDRARSVRRVVFDKTGTLTTGALRLVDREAVARLDASTQRLLFNLAARSSHPKAAAVRASVRRELQQFEPGLAVVEEPGRGLSIAAEGRTYRLGAPGWAVGPGAPGDIAFAVDGRALFVGDTEEELRPGAREEIRWLDRNGYEIWMLTGDRTDRALDVAAAVGIPPARVLARRTPDQKAAFVRSVDRADTLVLGDGINDAPAVRAAHCSGTPGAGRTFLAARTDFYLLGAGLGAVKLALAGARALRRAVRRNLALAIAYNTGAVGLALAGLMTPLLCAVLMPLSSLASIALTVRALGGKDAAWKS